MIDLIIFSILTLFESESIECDERFLSSPDFQNDDNHFR